MSDEDDWELPLASSSESETAYYAHFDDPTSHLFYVRDEGTTSAFRRAIAANASLLKDKVVLDLGCGPGHLALLCAKAGARHVYAVDGSEGAAAMARQVVAAAGLGDRITVIHGDVEEVSLLAAASSKGGRDLGGDGKVDVIVGDFVGPMVLGGGMMRALAVAKKLHLRPGGIILPDLVELEVAGVDDKDYLASSQQTWEGAIPGIDLSPVMSQVVRTPRLDILTRSSQLFTSTSSLLMLDLNGDQAVPKTLGGSGFSAPFEIRALRDERMHALVFWISFTFTFGGKAAQPVVSVSCDPCQGSPTHQKALFLNFPKSIRLSEGDSISGTVSCAPSEDDHRCILVDLEVDYKGVTATASYILPALMTSQAADHESI